MLIEEQEAGDNTVVLHEDQPSVANAMLSYLYTVSYTDELPEEAADFTEALVFNFHVYIIADKYDLPHLAKLAVSKFKGRADQDWKTPGFATAARLVFETNADKDHALRKIVTSTAIEHARALKTEDWADPFRAVTLAVPGLAFEMWQGLAVLEPKMLKCPNSSCSFRMCEHSLSQPGAPNNSAQIFRCGHCGFSYNAISWCR